LFRFIRSLILPFLLVMSLTLNVAMVVSASVFGAMSTLVEAFSGTRQMAVRSATEFQEVAAELDGQNRLNRQLRADLADVNKDLVAERQARRELSTALADATADAAAERKSRRELTAQLASAHAELVAEQQLKRELRTELAGMSSDLAAATAARQQIRDASSEIITRVTSRTTRSAQRETAVMAGEAVPFWGTAIIVTATAMELNDLCQTMKDMNELQALFDPSLTVPVDRLAVCGMEVPSRQKLWESASSAPGAAWVAARAAIPSIEEVKEFELPDVNWQSLRKRIGEGVTDMANGASEAAGGKWDQLKTWWSE
jgi:hypothetical protein